MHRGWRGLRVPLFLHAVGVLAMGLLLANCTGSDPLPTKAVAVTAAMPAPVAAATLLPSPTLRPSITPFLARASPSPPPIPTATASPTPTPCAPGTIQQGVYNSQVAGTAAYRIYLPPCYGADGRVYPTLYMLPGNIHTDSIWDELGLDEAAEAGIQTRQLPPLLIVMADGGSLAQNSSGGPGSYESLILHDLIPFIETNYCAWNEAAGRAIGGLSRGGYWSLEIAFRHPEHFASAGGHSAALLDTFAGPDLNPQYTGLNNDLGDLRIYFDIGAEDYVIHNIRKLHEEMETAGIPHTWVLNEGKHEEAYWASHVADYLQWYTAPWPSERTVYPLCTIPFPTKVPGT